MRVQSREPTAQGIASAIRWALPLPSHDAEEREDRRILRRCDLREAVRR